jgi:hypothetical protein
LISIGSVSRFYSDAICGMELRGRSGIQNDIFGFSPIGGLFDFTNCAGTWIVPFHPDLMSAISEMSEDVVICLESQDVKSPEIRDDFVNLLRNQEDNAAPILAIMTLKK